MHIQNKIHHSLAVAGYMLLFPIFFFYHIGIGKGYIPDFLSGLWGVASITIGFFGIVALVVTRKLNILISTSLLKIVTILVAYVALWTIVNYILLDDGSVQQVAKQFVALISAWIALTYIGLFLPWQNRKFILTNIWFLVAMLATTLLLFDRTYLFLDIRGDSSNLVDVASYQGFSRSALIVGFVILAGARDRLFKTISTFITVVLLFLVGARSELIGFCFAALLLFSADFVRYDVRGKSAKLLALVLLVLSLSYLLITSNGLESRQLQVLNISEASSWIARSRLTERAIQVIVDNPVVGDFTSHLGNNRSGDSGSYAHNLLSAWVALGIVGFALYLYICFLSIKFVLHSLLSANAISQDRSLGLLLTVFTLLLLLFAKPVFWPVPALAWGVCARVVIIERQNRKVSN